MRETVIFFPVLDRFRHVRDDLSLFKSKYCLNTTRAHILFSSIIQLEQALHLADKLVRNCHAQELKSSQDMLRYAEQASLSAKSGVRRRGQKEEALVVGQMHYQTPNAYC